MSHLPGEISPKNVRVATLHTAPHFNHSVAVDTFYIEWDGKKCASFTIMDGFSRYEIDTEIKDESAEMEIALFESTWSLTFGFPAILGWMLQALIGAHHRLGILERNHAVRRHAGSFTLG